MGGFSGTLPNYMLYIFGITHISLSFILMGISFGQMGVTADEIDDVWNPGSYNNTQPSRYQLYAYYPPVAVLFCSFMMMLAGLLAVSAPFSHNPFRQAAMVSGFKVMSIFVATIFAPICIGIGVTYGNLFSTDNKMGEVGITIAVFSGIEFIIAMVASCVTCCYSPYAIDDYEDDFRFQMPPPPLSYTMGPASVGPVGRTRPNWIRYF